MQLSVILNLLSQFLPKIWRVIERKLAQKKKQEVLNEQEQLVRDRLDDPAEHQRVSNDPRFIRNND